MKFVMLMNLIVVLSGVFLSSPAEARDPNRDYEDRVTVNRRGAQMDRRLDGAEWQLAGKGPNGVTYGVEHPRLGNCVMRVEKDRYGRVIHQGVDCTRDGRATVGRGQRNREYGYGG